MITLVQTGLPGPGQLAAVPGPGVEDGAGAGGVAVGEHGAPQHRPQELEVLLALVGVGHLALPESVALEVTIFLHNVITGAGVLGETLGVVRLSPGGDVVTGGEVGGAQEAAVPAAVVAPQVALIRVTAQLLTHTGGLARYDVGLDDLGWVGLAPGHRD